MKFELRGSVSRLLVVLLCVLAGGVEAKPIRLRNEIIEPDSPSARAARAAASASRQTPARGLFLVQFVETPRPEWREQLRALGVELLRFVPEDAFVAKLDGVPPGQIRKLGFVTAVTAYHPEHKLDRRLVRGDTDAPEVAIVLSAKASAAELADVKQLFDSASQIGELRSDRVVRGKLLPARLDALAQSDAVLWIEPAPRMKLVDEVASRIVGGDGPPGKTLVQSLGSDGSGVTVSVADSGLDSGDTNSMHPDIQGRVAALLAYGSLPDAADEHSHGTHVAGIIAGNGATGETDENGFLYGLGVAPGARLVAQRIFDADGGYVLPSTFDFETLTRDAKRAGADIGSNSWGDDTHGQYDTSAMRFDELVRDADELALGDQPYILEFSAGNAGPGYQTVGSPAVAKNVIATGASQNDRFDLPLADFAIYAEGRDAMCDFSSRGPCADGRIKPDLVAPGSWISSLRSIYANDDYAWWPISDNYLYQGGTSQAGPHVAGAAAVFVQYWRAHHAGATPSPALVKAALINSATDMDDFSGTDPVPNMDEGWGRVDLPALIASPRDYDFTDQSVLLTNGGVVEKRVLIGSAGEPLKITLAYTDVRGFPAAGIALVNDLDLEVLSPDGHLYRGNRFAGGDSIPDAPGADTINNVEAVHLFAPPPGEYIIRVRGSRIVEDARRDTVRVDQDFALVISGRFGTPGVGILTFDRGVYRAPDTIKLALVDYDLAGQGTANVLLRSGAEPSGESLTLHANGSSGVFTGAIATAIGPAASDGKLQVANSNVIEAVYADALPSSNRVFTGRVDLLPPVISSVQATNQFGQISVSWNTDEPARSEVYYGTPDPNRALTDATFDVTHEFALAGVAPQAVVKFFVVAQDEAGNRSTNNNSGSLFTITNTQPPEIFLVDSFADYLGLLPAPDLSGYTDALGALGVAYDFFDARSGALPSQAQLNAHRCVIWRMSDLESPSVTLANSISNYVSSGGSLLIASMEAVSRFSDAGLGSFNTSVLHVQSYTVDQVVSDVTGAPGEPVGTGINTTLDYTPYDTILAVVGVTDPSDWIVPDTHATSAILSVGAVVGLRAPKTGVDLPGRVVFLSFPLDAVPLGSGIGNNRAGLLRNILNFLAPPANTSTLTLDSDMYSVPGHAVIEVEDADMQGAGQLPVTVHSPQHTNQLAVSLLETARLGLFRGSVIFVQTNTGAPGTYRVDANDTVQFDYADASAGLTVSATASIETNPPVIANVVIEPGYLEALVTWDTSEPADSLVQYSQTPDSFPVNFTAYDPTFATSHAVYVTGLQPNTTYYLRVSSRDHAGNSATDDNGGTNYTFTTLLPLTPPWSDNMETNNLEWSTFAAADSDTEWTRGPPGGGETGHDSTNCWGSNLSGGQVSQLETLLVSPGVFLTGGNKATLRFWQNYDFTPQTDFELQIAEVQVITNALTAPLSLVTMPTAASDGWKEMEVDLTPFAGNVVYIVWYHFLFAIDNPPRLGWLVDDVSITTETVAPGTIQVTNNISQAVFALSGPSGRLGNGLWTRITNAVPGKYTIEFGDAPYFNTPAPQTNTLVTGGTITFAGNYTFPDANSNGIPDGWELANFGVIDPLRTRTTDTDRDGLSDYAEFVAGTDPNNPPPPFRVTAQLTNGLVRLSWPTTTNLTYRVVATGALPTLSWLPYSGWMNPTGFLTSFSLPAATNGAPHFFRVEAAPNGPLAGLFRISGHTLTNGQFRLDWPSAPGHGYRVLGGSNGSVLVPLGDWIRASDYTTSLTLPPPTNGAPRFFRIEARP